MRRLLIDLDNTLVDRDAAFAAWAGDFVDEVGGGPEDRDWLLSADADGYTPRARLADAIKERFGLPISREGLVDRLLFEHVELIEPVPGVPEVLASLAELGIERIIVSNGTEAQQQRKLLRTGLVELVDAVIISEAAGCAKPDPRIFRLAVGDEDPSAAWMIGDHPEADVRGAARVGLRTGWVDRGRSWSGGDPPTVAARTAPAVIAQSLKFASA